MSSYIQLVNNLEQLKLTKIREYIPNYLDDNVRNNLSIVDILKELTDKEIEFREERAAQINLTISNFPYHKTINDFDFNYQPQINKSAIEDLCSLRFMETKSNVVFMGHSRCRQNSFSDIYWY